MSNDGLRVRTLAGRSGSDDLQTPPEAVVPLLPYLPRFGVIWECAVGGGNIMRVLQEHGATVFGSDIWNGAVGVRLNFLTDLPPRAFSCIVTNPPYSIKRKFVARCYELGKPWALLMPVAVLGVGWMQTLAKKYGLEVLFLNRRVNFTGGHGSWFAVAWYTWGLGLPSPMTFGELPRA